MGPSLIPAGLLLCVRMAAASSPRTESLFDTGWKFFRALDVAAVQPAADDAAWKPVELPHDWSIEDLPPLGDVPAALPVVKGEWKFRKGDDPAWKDPKQDDHGWETVALPAHWEDHSGYTLDHVYGWFRRRIVVPKEQAGTPQVLDLGQIDDVDETFVNGVKIGGLGSFPPDYKTAWNITRRYPVPAGLLKGDGSDLVAVRCFDGEGKGGIWKEGGPQIRIGPFDSTLSSGDWGTGHVVGGTGWYVKDFMTPMEWTGKRIRLEFDGSYMDTTVWLNGTEVGKHPYGYTPFGIDLTDQVVPQGRHNILAVRVRNLGVNTRWYAGSGIFRHVRLVVTNPIRIADQGLFITTPKVTPAAATVKALIEVENRSDAPAPLTLRLKISGPGGSPGGKADLKGSVPAGGKKTFSIPVKVTGPRLWSPDSPVLYQAEVEVVAGTKQADRVTVPFGIRTFEADPEKGLLLNGKEIKLKGGCVHHDHGPLGAAALGRAEERRVEILKAAGYNAIRTSHNPPSKEFLNACDRIGMLVVDEIFDCWEDGKNADDYGRFFREWWKTDVTNWVRRDRNHPCVIMWSTGNEIPERYEPRGVKTSKMLADAIRDLDPTRPVTSAFNGVDDRADPYLEPLDVSGYNYNPNKYLPDRARHPKRLMMATESVAKESFDYWAAVTSTPFVVGDFIWTAWDYLGESGIGHSRFKGEPDTFQRPWPWFVSNCSDFDYCGFVKPQGLYRQVMWGTRKLALVVHRPLPEGKTEELSYWGWPDVVESWNLTGSEGKTMEVHAYADCETVKLFLNGKEIGSKPGGRAARYDVTFTVPYEKGELKAIALTKGKAVAEASLTTAGRPANIRLTADRDSIANDRDDLCYVKVEVLDADGHLVPDEEGPTIRFTVTGPGELAAVGSGSPTKMESFRQPRRTPWRGRCLAILRPKDMGTMILKAEGDGLFPSEVRILIR